MKPDWCFDIPIDHRLKRFLAKPQNDPPAGIEVHTLTYKKYGRSLQKSQTRHHQFLKKRSNLANGWLVPEDVTDW